MNKNYILSVFVGLVVLATAQTTFAKTATISAISPNSGDTMQVGVAQTIRWTSSNYPAGKGVNINLLRQISGNPNRFELVKTIKKDTPNGGNEVWTPSAGDTGNNLVIQVSCSSSVVFPDGCSSGGGNAQLSVIDKVKNQSATASILSSISEVLNKISNLLNSMFKK